MIYQLMFAIITPALISGAFAERMKFSAMLLFMTLWSFVVYFPMAHWCGQGRLSERGAGGAYPAFDFAGGTVVHITSGVSALVCAYTGQTHDYPSESMRRTACAERDRRVPAVGGLVRIQRAARWQRALWRQCIYRHALRHGRAVLGGWR